MIALTSALIYIHLCTRINYLDYGGWTQHHAASQQLHGNPHFSREPAAMTELVGVAEPTQDELPPSFETAESSLEQALKEADAAAATAMATATEAREQGPSLRPWRRGLCPLGAGGAICLAG